MSEEAFLQQLDAQPDDNVLRLVYADWLDEHDDPRGEFLRTAVALQQNALTGEQLAEARRRILELRPRVPASWLVRALRGYAEDDVREGVFRAAFGNPADVQFARGPVVGPFVQVESWRD